MQDDWRVCPTLKFLYGVRYDFYDFPDGDPAAPVETSRDLPVDKSNFAPRVGAVWSLGERAPVGASRQLRHHVRPDAHRNLRTGAPERRHQPARLANFTPTQIGAPAYPAILTAGAGAQPNVAWTVDPDFTVARTWQNNVQFERALADQYSVSIGASYVKGYNLPVVTNINLINPTGSTPSGIPIFNPTVNADTRVDPRYNPINSTQSLGDSTYKNLMLLLTRRNVNGIGFDFDYTLGKSKDNAPITNALSVQGDAGGNDPTNLDRDLGPNVLDQRHTFAGSIVATPRFDRERHRRRHPQQQRLRDRAAVRERHSRQPASQRRDQQRRHGQRSADGVGRNSLHLPARYNVDSRFSRRIPRGRQPRRRSDCRGQEPVQHGADLRCERHHRDQRAGRADRELPTSADQLTPTGGYEQRQLQLGFKFTF